MELFINLLKKKKEDFGFCSSCVQGFVAAFLLPIYLHGGGRDSDGPASD